MGTEISGVALVAIGGIWSVISNLVTRLLNLEQVMSMSTHSPVWRGTWVTTPSATVGAKAGSAAAAAKPLLKTDCAGAAVNAGSTAGATA